MMSPLRQRILILTQAYAFALPLSVGLSNLLAGLGSLFCLIWIFTGRIRLRLKGNLALQMFGIYLSLYLFGTLYSENPAHGLKESLGHLRLIFAVCLPFLLSQESLGKIIRLFGFSLRISGVVYLFALTGLIRSENPAGALYGSARAIQDFFFSLHQFEGLKLDIFGIGGSPFVNRVQWAPLLAFGVGALLFVIRRNGWKNTSLRRYIELLLALSLLVISEGRSGMLLALLGAVAVLWYQTPLKNRLFQTLGVGLVALGMVAFLPPVQSRVHQLYLGYEAFQKGEFGYGIGDRLMYLVTGFATFQKAPLLGHGTGSFYVANAEESRRIYPQIEPTQNPHNQYMFQMVEHGLLGFMVMLLLFWGLAYQAIGLRNETEFLFFMACAGFGVISISCTYLLDQPMQHLYWLMLGLAALPASGGRGSEEERP